MKNTNKIWTSIGVSLIGLSVLTGCGTSSSSVTPPPPPAPTNTTNTTNTTNNSGPLGNVSIGNGTTVNNTSNTSNVTNSTTPNNTTSPTQTASNNTFPSLVQQAMSQVKSPLTSGVDAPTTLPQAASSSATVTYNTTQKDNSSFQVTLNAAGTKMAAWNVAHFSSNSQAQTAYAATAVQVAAPKNSQATIILTGNHTAYVTNDASGSTSVTWTQGNWKIDVTNQGTMVAPSPLADQVAEYLDNNALPTPTGQGSIRVLSDGSSSTAIDVQVIWQSGINVYSVETTASALTPVSSALQMATSMKPWG